MVCCCVSVGATSSILDESGPLIDGLAQRVLLQGGALVFNRVSNWFLVGAKCCRCGSSSALKGCAAVEAPLWDYCRYLLSHLTHCLSRFQASSSSIKVAPGSCARMGLWWCHYCFWNTISKLWRYKYKMLYHIELFANGKLASYLPQCVAMAHHQ